MALNTRSAIHPKWLTHNVTVENGFRLAEIEIFDPKGSDATYNATNNTWSSAREVFWTGKARIQTVRNTVTRQNSINATDAQPFEVHIDMRGNTLEGHEGELPDIRPNHNIFVTSSPYDASLENYIFVVTGSLSTSNPWGKMIQCEVDQEVRRAAAS